MELESYQRDYLFSLTEYSEELDNLILELENNFSTDLLARIKRRVHSIKGAAASYDFAFASTICHNFEDFLEANAKQTSLKPEQIDQLIKYNDLLKDYINSFDSYSPTEINDLKQRLFAISSLDQDQILNHHVLVVDPTKTFKKICEHTLKGLQIKVSTTDNGYTALGRLLNEDFDAVIVSKELRHIDGISLIEMIKNIKGLNLNLPVVLVSSNIQNLNLKVEPDFILSKNENFRETLASSLEKIIHKGEQTSDELSSDLPFGKVAYIDDDKDVHTLVKLSMMKDHPNLDISFSTDPEEGLKKLLANPPELVLLDVEMPKINGDELFKKLKEEKPDHPWKVIFFTGNSQASSVKKLKDLGAIGVITKPFKPQNLFKDITSAWRSSQ